MHIYLRHPKHGTKVAISDMEAAADEQNGWVRYTPGTPSNTDDAAPENGLTVKRRRRTQPQELEA
jgi:hypothetical protein